MWIVGLVVGGLILGGVLLLLVRAWAVLAHEALRESSVSQAERFRHGKDE